MRRHIPELAALHSDFDRAVRARTSDLASIRELLIHFEAGLIWSDDETAREAAEKLAPTMASFRSVYDEILAAGRQGWFGYISI